MTDTHTDSSSVLSETTSIRGRISGEGDLEVRGRVEGEIDVTGTLVIADGATVRGNVRAARVELRGALRGDVVATESIALDESARLLGNVQAPRVAIALGAQFRGSIDMGGDYSPARVGAAPASATAPAGASRAPAPVASASTSAAHTASAATSNVAAIPPRPPFSVARPVSVPRRPVASVETVASASQAPAPADAENDHEASTSSPSVAPEPGRREPPLPLVPAIRKGAKAPPPKKRGVLG